MLSSVHRGVYDNDTHNENKFIAKGWTMIELNMTFITTFYEIEQF